MAETSTDDKNNQSTWYGTAWDWTTSTASDLAYGAAAAGSVIVTDPKHAAALLGEGVARGAVKAVPLLGATGADIVNWGARHTVGEIYSGSAINGVNSAMDTGIGWAEDQTGIKVEVNGKGDEFLHGTGEFAGGFVAGGGATKLLKEGVAIALTARTGRTIVTAATETAEATSVTTPALIPTLKESGQIFAEIPKTNLTMTGRQARSMMYDSSLGLDTRLLKLSEAGYSDRANMLFGRTLAKGVSKDAYTSLVQNGSKMPDGVQSALIRSYELRNFGNPLTRRAASLTDRLLATTDYTKNFGFKAAGDTVVNTLSATPSVAFKAAAYPVMHPIKTAMLPFKVAAVGTGVAAVAGTGILADQLLLDGKVTKAVSPLVEPIITTGQKAAASTLQWTGSKMGGVAGTAFNLAGQAIEPSYSGKGPLESLGGLAAAHPLMTAGLAWGMFGGDGITGKMTYMIGMAMLAFALEKMIGPERGSQIGAAVGAAAKDLMSGNLQAVPNDLAGAFGPAAGGTPYQAAPGAHFQRAMAPAYAMPAPTM